MKLSEHVKTIRELIYSAFVNQFARLGITAENQRDLELNPEALAARRKLDAIIANHIEETGSYQGAYEKALDEYTVYALQPASRAQGDGVPPDVSGSDHQTG